MGTELGARVEDWDRFHGILQVTCILQCGVRKMVLNFPLSERQTCLSISRDRCAGTYQANPCSPSGDMWASGFLGPDLCLQALVKKPVASSPAGTASGQLSGSEEWLSRFLLKQVCAASAALEGFFLLLMVPR